MQGKKIPERKCVGCGASKPKKDLIRVVRAPDESISIDFKGKKSGRGAYLCHDIKCLKMARKAKRLEHHLEVSIPDEIYDRLEVEMTDSEQSEG